ncbi:MAG: PilZ domain-containing protein [Myxococcota bacterium]
MSSPPPVLLLDDGELESVRLLLDEMGAEYVRLQSSDSGSGIPSPARLLVTTARIAHSLRLERTLTPAPNRAIWIAFVTGDSKTQKTLMQKSGFDFLIREPVHPAALRVLLQRALFHGSDTRRAPRVACGHPIRYRTGFWPRPGMLVDLSPRGCRLLIRAPLAEKTAISIQIPRALAGGKSLKLAGHAVRVSRADREGGVAAEFSVGVRFGALNDRTKLRLRDVLAERVIGPAALDVAIPFTPAESRPAAPVAAAGAPSPVRPPAEDPKRQRRVNARAKFRKQVTAVEGGDSYMILCLDISVGGMRIEAVEGLGVGAKLNLAIQISAREEPVMVEAAVLRDDGENGLALQFDWVSPESKRRIERLLETLPAIEALHAEARRHGTILAQRLARSPRPKTDGRS